MFTRVKASIHAFNHALTQFIDQGAIPDTNEKAAIQSRIKLSNKMAEQLAPEPQPSKSVDPSIWQTQLENAQLMQHFIHHPASLNAAINQLDKTKSPAYASLRKIPKDTDEDTDKWLSSLKTFTEEAFVGENRQSLLSSIAQMIQAVLGAPFKCPESAVVSTQAPAPQHNAYLSETQVKNHSFVVKIQQFWRKWQKKRKTNTDASKPHDPNNPTNHSTS